VDVPIQFLDVKTAVRFLAARGIRHPFILGPCV
jgi:hypothetical protein